MDCNNKYEFIPIAPVDHNAIPDAMKEFINKCGMMGIIPSRNCGFEDGVIKEMNFQMCGGDIESVEAVDDRLEPMSDKKGGIIEREDEDEKVDRVLTEIENNNLGVLKFLEARGMTRELSKKFIKRVVRLSIRYE